MKAHILRMLLILSFVVAAGCSNNDPAGLNAPSSSTGNAAIFNPSSGEIPLPNILATAANTDPLSGRAANSPMDPSAALKYVNFYEVGKTSAVAGVNAPIYIRFSAPVDATTVTAANIKVFQLTPDIAGTENNPLGFTDVSGMFKYKYAAGSTDLFLEPNFPMLPATRYLYVVSNRVKDAASGNPIVSSNYFDMLKSLFPLVGPFAALEPIRANAMSGANIKLSGYAKVMDDLIAAGKVANRTEIALMGRFITSSAGFVPKITTGAGGTVVATDLVPSNLVPVESALRAFSAGKTVTGTPVKVWDNGITVTSPAGMTPDAYWTKVTGSTTTLPGSVASVATGTFNSAQLSIDPVVKSANASAAFGNLSGIAGAYNPAAGVVQSYRNSTTGNLEGYYYTPSHVPFVYMTSKTPNGNLVIFQHGITGQKEQVIAAASSLTAAGYAVIAIDLPLHGELAIQSHKGTGVGSALIPGVSPPTTFGALWGQDFMAVGAPLATRSNIQQAAFNLNRLEIAVKTGGLALAGLASAPPTEIKYVGISLGSIVGAYYLAGNTANGAFPTATDMKGFLSVPGGRTAYLIQNSPAFGPSVDAGLAAKGIVKNSPTYHNFFQVTQSVVDPVDPATMTTPLPAPSPAILPSRLSGRIAIQEAIGDQVIPNDNTRYFGNALGGRGALNTAAALAVAPGFSQLKYLDGSLPSLFMYTRAGGVVDGALTDKTALARAQSVAGTTPAEGYFQFNQAGIGHGFLIDFSTPANTILAQTQMVAFLLKGVVIDPTTAGPLAKTVAAAVPAGLYREILLPKVVDILGY
jgi:hypothetical protein